MDGTDLAEEVDKWQALVNAAMTLRGLLISWLTENRFHAVSK